MNRCIDTIFKGDSFEHPTKGYCRVTKVTARTIEINHKLGRSKVTYRKSHEIVRNSDFT